MGHHTRTTALEQTCWRWELTPKELFAGFRFIRSEPTQSFTTEVLPFACPKQVLPGTDLHYQLALSDQSVCEEVQLLRRAQPDLSLSGDRRSGVILFQGQTLIGALVIQGNMVNQGYKLFVRPTHRQTGLASKLLVEWCWHTRRQRVLPSQGITLHSAKALLAAHRVVVERATQAGLGVPDRVLEAIERGDETSQIIARATVIENLPANQTSRAHAK
jgi:hypothetical protein